MDTNGEQTLNPWFSIWLRPRDTIQQIVGSDPLRLVLLLAAIGGFAGALDRASYRSAGDELGMPMIFAVAAIAGPIGGIIGLYFGGALLSWTGKWIGGIASSENIRAALAWSSVPLIWALLLWIPQLTLFGKELFTSETPRMDADATLIFTFLAFAIIELVIAIWTLIIFLKCLGQVQGFSAWKALGNSLLSVLVIILPFFAILVVIATMSS